MLYEANDKGGDGDRNALKKTPILTGHLMVLETSCTVGRVFLISSTAHKNT